MVILSFFVIHFRNEKILSTCINKPSNLKNCLVENTSTLQWTKSNLKKYRSCPSIVYRLLCDNCRYEHHTVCKCCVICELNVSSINIMLFKNNSKIKDQSDTGVVSNYHLPQINSCARFLKLSLSYNNLEKSMDNSIVSSRKNLLSDINMWLCRMCFHSNSQTTIKCIICKNEKTDIYDNDNNNIVDDRNNNKRSNSDDDYSHSFEDVNTNIAVLPKIIKKMNLKNEEKKACRRSYSFTPQKQMKLQQRLSLPNTDEKNLSSTSPKYSYIGISEPLPLVYNVNSSQNEVNWTCDRCSYADNLPCSSRCNFCDELASECSAITVEKDSVRYTPPKRRINSEPSTTDPLQQNLDGDFQFLPMDPYNREEWVCKKCTLVNSDSAAICVVCGGSKIRSLTSTPETTFKKGEFWMCPRCTLKNSLKDSVCILCKTPHSEVDTSVKYNTNTGLYSDNSLPKQKTRDKKPVSGISLKPKSFNFSEKENIDFVYDAKETKTWICEKCTFENSVESPCCEICQITRTICNNSLESSTNTFSKHLSDNDSKSIVIQSKQQSELMEQLRQNEEEEALIKWQQIVQYCKEVNVI